MNETKNYWWVWLLIGLVMSLLMPTGGLLNSVGSLVLISIGIYSKIAKTSQILPVVITFLVVLFYAYMVMLLSGELPKLI